MLLVCFFFISAKAELINDIKLENNKRVSKESIIAFGNIKLGKEYSETELNQILLDLYETNFFLNINFLKSISLFTGMCINLFSLLSRQA